MKIALRFLVVFVLLVISLFIIYSAIHVEQKDDLKFTTNELNGVEYLKGMYQLSIATALYQADYNINSSPQVIENSRKNLLHAIESMKKLEKKYPQFQNHSLDINMRKIKQDSFNNDIYYQFLDILNDENYRVGDISQLLFEKDRKLYFLSSLLTHYMPEYLISVLIAHSIAEEFAQKQSISHEKELLYVEQSKLMYLSVQEINSIVELLQPYKDTASLRSFMDKIRYEFQKLEREQSNFSHWKDNKEDLEHYLNTFHYILKLSYKLNDKHIEILEKSLLERKDYLLTKIYITQAIFILLSLILGVVLFFYYRSYSSNIKKDKEIKKTSQTLDKLVVFFKTDLEGNITYTSDALEEMSGYKRQELLGNTQNIFLCDSQYSTTLKSLYNVAILNKKWIGEFKNKRKNKTIYWVRATVIPEVNDTNQIIGFNNYWENITDKKNLEEEKRKTQEALEFKSKFLSNMSHEIRTPLNGIIGLTSIALKMEKNPKQKDLLTKITSASNILLSLINDILDISKIESGKMEIEKLPFNLKTTIQNLYDMLVIRANEKGISLKLSFKNLTYNSVIGDSLRISQVLTNLLNNAIKFTADGVVTLEVEALEGDMIRFKVIDTGIGLKEEYLTSLFEEFTQADMSTSRKYGGTGLGLSISKNLVELMGGKIWVESEYGEGSTFGFEIPLEAIVEENIEQEVKEEVIQHRDNEMQEVDSSVEKFEDDFDKLEGYSILVAEDNAMNQMVLELLFEDTGLNVTFANDGEIAVEKFKNNNYDLILMDIQMPNMNGLEATREIRKIDTNIPIIGLSANVMKEDIDETKKAGMNEHLAKPIDTDKLFSTLVKYLVN